MNEKIKIIFILLVLAFGIYAGALAGSDAGKVYLITNYCAADDTITLASRDECIANMEQYK